MKLFTAGFFATLCTAAALTVRPHDHGKVVCFWNSTSFERRGSGKFQVYHSHPALPLCTHLVYGFAGINTKTLEVVPLHPHIDIRGGIDLYRAVLQLKRINRNLKVCLSIGGNADPYEEMHKYLVMTRSSEVRNKFVESVGRLLLEYDFDCVDLAWQFPEAGGYGKFKDTHQAEHRDGFTILVRNLKNLLRQRNNKELTLTVLPHVNATAYFDARSLVPNIDAVHLFAFDQKTPDRNPTEADFPAPIYESFGRVRDENIDAQVRFWLERRTPRWKLVVGIPTFARTWRVTEESETSGVPLIDTDGPGAAGPDTAIPGLLSFTEVCTRLMEPVSDHVRRVSGSSKKYGNYVFWSFNVQTKTDGIWVGFEEPDTAGIKAGYAKSKKLGGIAIYDISLDDFRGICIEDKFPILRAARKRLLV